MYKQQAPYSGGVLYLVGTPYGHSGELTPRAAEVLNKAATILVEDTRNWRHLTTSCGLQPQGKVVSFNKDSENGKTPIALEALTSGQAVALVSDAGVPVLADPGLPLVQAAISAEVPVVPVAFGSPLLAALAASGLPAVPFHFEGFLPKSAVQRSAKLAELATLPYTTAYFEAPNRSAAALEAMQTAFGSNRQACLAREISKTYESFWHGDLAALAAAAKAEPPKGAVVILIAGDCRGTKWQEQEVKDAIQAGLKTGTAPKTLRDELAQKSGWGKRDVYQLILAIKSK